MEYSFSIGAFVFGLLIAIASTVFVRFHQKIADNLGNGVSSYDRYRLAGFIGIGVGVAFMLNIPVVILTFIFNAFFNF